jgi:hypothetical protein
MNAYVQKAILSGNHEALSRMALSSARKRKQKAEERKILVKKKRIELLRLAADSLKVAQQAHEDICPVDD